MTWLWLLWLPCSYILHLILHEGSHVIMGRIFGIESTFHLFPKRLPDGRFVFAYTSYKDNKVNKLSDNKRLLISAAPLITELIWIVITGLLLGLLGFNWFLLIEYISSIIDSLVLLVGFFTLKPNIDAEKIYRTSMMKLTTLRLLAIAYIAGVIGVLWILI